MILSPNKVFSIRIELLKSGLSLRNRLPKVCKHVCPIPMCATCHAKFIVIYLMAVIIHMEIYLLEIVLH
jgi:hypothetical protein